jgi:hypothetical protein
LLAGGELADGELADDASNTKLLSVFTHTDLLGYTDQDGPKQSAALTVAAQRWSARRRDGGNAALAR